MEKELSAATKAALEVLEAANEPLSLAQISDRAGVKVSAGNLSSFIKKGIVASVEATEVRPTAYVFTKFALTNPEGIDPNKELSVGAKAAIDVLAASNEPLSLKEISDRAGMDIKPGHLSSFVKKGIVTSTKCDGVRDEEHTFKKFYLVK